MRPTVILLLLCALFLTADTVSPCDKSLITGVAAVEIKFDEATKTLTCIDDRPPAYSAYCRPEWNAQLKAIQFESKLYPMLKCDQVKGWKDGNEYNGTENPRIADASSPIEVKCVEYCALGGIRSCIKRERFGESEHKREAKCMTGYRLFVGDTDIGTADLLCHNHVAGTGWFKQVAGSRWNNELITANITTPLEAECRSPCEHGKRDGVKSAYERDDHTTTFKCKEPKHGVRLTGTTTVYGQLKCKRNVGYTDVTGNVIAADAFAGLDLECVAGNPCSYNALDSPDIHFDSYTLTCENANSLMAIEFDSTLYTSLTCSDTHGWMAGETTLLDAYTTINVKCVEYCAVSMKGDVKSKIQDAKFSRIKKISEKERDVSCYENPTNPTNIKVNKDKVDENLILLLNEKPIAYYAYNYVTCDFVYGWMTGQLRTHGNTPILNDTSVPVNVECKRACVQHTLGDGVNETSFDKHNAYLAKYTCNKDAVNGERYGVRVTADSGELISPEVFCSARGYTSIDNYNDPSYKMVGNAFKPANLDCAILPPTTTSTTTTTTTTTPTPIVAPEKPSEHDDNKKASEEDEKSESGLSPSKPSENGNDQPRSTHSPISVVSLYLIACILVLYGNL